MNKTTFSEYVSFSGPPETFSLIVGLSLYQVLQVLDKSNTTEKFIIKINSTLFAHNLQRIYLFLFLIVWLLLP